VHQDQRAASAMRDRRRREYAEIVFDHRVECSLLLRLERAEEGHVEPFPGLSTVLDFGFHIVGGSLTASCFTMYITDTL